MQKILNLILNEWNWFSSNFSEIQIQLKRKNEIQFSTSHLFYKSVHYRFENKQADSDTKVNYSFKIRFWMKLLVFPFYLIYIILAEVIYRLPIFDDDL